METQIKNIFSTNLITLKETDSLHNAESIMTNNNIRHLPIVDDENILVGILSRSDFIALKHVDSSLSKFKIQTLMSSPVKTLSITAKVKDVARLFITKKINSAVIVDHDDVVGIVTSEDLIQLLANSDTLSHETESMDLAELASEGWISMTTLTQ
ncbi:MAG: CBS domain-containing protein [Pseudobdellovibrio sp.]